MLEVSLNSLLRLSEVSVESPIEHSESERKKPEILMQLHFASKGFENPDEVRIDLLRLNLGITSTNTPSRPCYGIKLENARSAAPSVQDDSFV